MTQAALSITMVAGLFRPYGSGAERQAEHLSVALQEKGVGIEVVTLRPRGLPARLPDDPVPVTRLWSPGIGRLKETFFLYALYRYLLKTPGRIIHVHQGMRPAFAAACAAARLNRPLLVKCGNAGPRFDLKLLSERYWGGRRMAGKVAATASGFVALNSQIKVELAAWGVAPERIAEIPNGVVAADEISTVERQQARQRWGCRGTAGVVVTIGTLTPKKDFSTLIKALGCLPEHQQPELLLVGHGDLEAQLRREAEAQKVRVVFAGRVQADEVRSCLAAADLFVLPSLTEGISNALLEALAAGVPCLASDIPGNRALIEPEKSGWLFPPGDAARLSSQITQFLHDQPQLHKIAAAGRARALGEFAISRVTEKYLELYQALLERGSVHFGRDG